MKEILEVILTEQRAQGSRQDEMNATLVKLTAAVEHHVKRTDLLESRVEPVAAHVALVNTLAKIAAGLGAILVFAHELGLF